MNERDEFAVKAAIKAMEDSAQREIVKQAVKELLAEYAKSFGWWSLRYIGVALIGALVLFILYANGWAKS